MASDRKVVKQASKKSQGVKGLPTMGQLVKAKRKQEVKAAGKPKPWTMAEKIEAVDLYAELKDTAQVAVKLGRSEESVAKLVRAYQSTTKAARMVMEAGAAKLAANVVKNANVEESLEVLDRLNVINKHRDKGGSTPTHSLLIVGMPGARDNNPLPLPSQKQIEEAIDAVVVKPPIPDIPAEATDADRST